MKFDQKVKELENDCATKRQALYKGQTIASAKFFVSSIIISCAGTKSTSSKLEKKIHVLNPFLLY